MKSLFFETCRNGLVRVKPVRKEDNHYLVEVVNNKHPCYKQGEQIITSGSWLVNKARRRGVYCRVKEARLSDYF